MKKREIIFVRHAESKANAGEKTPDAHSIPLSEKGKVQAEELAQHFPLKPKLIILSTFLRTKETAQPLIEKLDTVQIEIWDMIHEFTYLDRTRCKNTTMQERKKYAENYWSKMDPWYKDGPEEENFFELLGRAEKFLEKINLVKTNSIAIFSHGQFLTALKIVRPLDKKIEELTKSEIQNLMNNFYRLQNETPIKNTEIIDFENI